MALQAGTFTVSDTLVTMQQMYGEDPRQGPRTWRWSFVIKGDPITCHYPLDAKGQAPNTGRSIRARSPSIILVALALSCLPAGSRLPAREAELAATDRPSWLAALAAACDALTVDSTWRVRPVPDSRAALPLPPAIAAEAGAVHGCCWDTFPVPPRGRYEIGPVDRVTGRLMLMNTGVVIGCPQPDPAPSPAAPSVRILGGDELGGDRRRREPWSSRGIWYVLAVLPGEEGWLLGMSRDLWGARALVGAMRAMSLAPRDSVPP